MTAPAITVDGISKRYRIGLAPERFPTFRDAIVGAITAPIRRWHRLREGGNGEDTIWALKDISFDVEPGEVLGIIGRNGAGKSTLLKILSRITEPTEGVIRIGGRVASLLEVGTGFHPELTGRENIYLNGAILGMKKVEIDQKFDEIVAFAGTERFLDTPVKRYSSGMYVRLAFAVAAHLEPEILLVDEVLAVGDSEFQRKCLGRMKDVAASGRTVLFISHNMNAVNSLCNRSIILEGGAKIRDGRPDEVIEAYLSSFRDPACTIEFSDVTEREGSGEARFVAIRFYDGSGQPVSNVRMGSQLTIELAFVCSRPLERPRFHLHFVNRLGQIVFRARTRAALGALPIAQRGGKVTCQFPSLNLVPGVYRISVHLNDSAAKRVDELEEAATIEVVEADVCGTGELPCGRRDLMYMPAEWSTCYT
jgi:lipopolysaccharide transport system ATP-binding protein